MVISLRPARGNLHSDGAALNIGLKPQFGDRVRGGRHQSNVVVRQLLHAITADGWRRRRLKRGDSSRKKHLLNLLDGVVARVDIQGRIERGPVPLR